MARFAWCPSCGKDTERPYASCPWCTAEIPLYVQVNAVVQYLVGVPTFVEFRLLNSSEAPVTLQSFEVRLGGELLKPGVYSEVSGQTIPPGDNNALLVDRKVDFAINKVMPGQYLLQITTAFSSSDREFTLCGAHGVVFDRPGTRHIHIVDPEDQSSQEMEDGSLPDGEAQAVDHFGEELNLTFQVRYIAALKRESGLRFVPVHMSYRTAPKSLQNARTATEGAPACDKCGRVLAEVGHFCHDCGEALTLLPGTCTAKQGKLTAKCPHCKRDLADRHRFCPYCGGAVHLYIDINELSFYRQGTSTKAELLLHSVHGHDIILRQFEVSLDDTKLKSAVHSPKPNQLLRSGSAPLRTDWVVYPSRSGQAPFDISILYETQGATYKLTGGHWVEILGANTTPQQIVYAIDNRVLQSGEGVHSAGNRITEIKSQGIKVDTVQELKEYLEIIGKEQGFVYLPLSNVDIELLSKPEPPRPRPAVPDWAPSSRSRIWFEHNGILHNYCLLSTYSAESGAYGRVKLGRDPNWADIRLYEVERYKAEVEHRTRNRIETKGSASRVSARQWEISIQSGQQRPGGLTIKNLQEKHYTIVPGERKLGVNAACCLGRNEQVVFRGADNSGDLIGLRYGANAAKFPELEDRFKAARETLDRMPKRRATLPPWSGPYGGYRLSRLFSLTGERIEGIEDLKKLEVYVLVPGWVTVGSSPDACLVVPDEKVSGVHAYLLHIDGYYFLAPRDESTQVYVDDEAIPAGVPWPLKPEATRFRIGSTTLSFGQFDQIL